MIAKLVVRLPVDDGSFYSRGGRRSSTREPVGNISSFGEFRNRLYCRSGATACNAALLDLVRSSVCGCYIDTIYKHIHDRAQHSLSLSLFPSLSSSPPLCHIRAQKLRYTGGRCGIYPSSVTTRHFTPRLPRYRRFCTCLPASVNLTPGITVRPFAGKVDALEECRPISGRALLIRRSCGGHFCCSIDIACSRENLYTERIRQGRIARTHEYKIRSFYYLRILRARSAVQDNSSSSRKFSVTSLMRRIIRNKRIPL